MKKHLKLFSLIALAVSSICVSFATVNNEEGGNHSIKEADAASIPDYIYVTVESSFNNRDVANIYADAMNRFGSLRWTWPGVKMSSVLSEHPFGEEYDVGKFYSGASEYRYLIINNGGTNIKTNKSPDLNLEDAKSKGMNWYDFIGTLDGDGNPLGMWGYYSEGNMSSYINKPRKMYLDIASTSFWYTGQLSGKTTDQIKTYLSSYLYVQFQAELSGSDPESTTTRDSYKVEMKVNTFEVDKYGKVFPVVSVPLPATKVRFVLDPGKSSSASYNEYYSRWVNIPDNKANNMVYVYGTHSGGIDSSHQECEIRKSPMEVNDKLFFKYDEGADNWEDLIEADDSSIRAKFYASNGSLSYAVGEYKSGTTDMYIDDVGIDSIDTTNKYVSFSVPALATSVEFYINDSDSNNDKTNSVNLSFNNKRTIELSSSHASDTKHDLVYLESGYDYSFSTTASNASARLFFNNTRYTPNYKWISQASTTYYALECWNSTIPDPYEKQSHIFYFNGWFDGMGSAAKLYNYVDVPLGLYDKCRIVIMSSNTGSPTILYGSSTVISLDDDTFSICYYIDDITRNKSDTYGVYATNSAQTINDDGAYGLMAKVIEACNTCSSDKRNGYGNIDALKTNFYVNQTTDYPVTSLNGGTPYYISEHIAEMEKRASGSGSRSSVRVPRDYELDSSRIVIIIVISSLSLVAFSIITLYINKKRKHS